MKKRGPGKEVERCLIVLASPPHLLLLPQEGVKKQADERRVQFGMGGHLEVVREKENESEFTRERAGKETARTTSILGERRGTQTHRGHRRLSAPSGVLPDRGVPPQRRFPDFCINFNLLLFMVLVLRVAASLPLCVIK